MYSYVYGILNVPEDSRSQCSLSLCKSIIFSTHIDVMVAMIIIQVLYSNFINKMSINYIVYIVM